MLGVALVVVAAEKCIQPRTQTTLHEQVNKKCDSLIATWFLDVLGSFSPASTPEDES